MAGWDDVVDELLRKVFSIDADVRFRLLALQQQCDKLQAIHQRICDLQAAHLEEKTKQQAEAVAVEQSIKDAIRRARQVRAKLAAQSDSSDEETDDKQAPSVDAKEEQLQSILAVAKATRTASNSELPLVHRFALEYPRKLKALEDQLEEVRTKEKEASTRFNFCCKMNEHLALNHKRRQLILQQQQRFGQSGRTDVAVARIQTSFPMQMIRLQGGYQRLMEFVRERIEVGSPHFQQIVAAPTLSSVFPIYHRLKQAKKMLRLLNNEARALLKRLPTSPPELSSAAAAHRDAMLARIRRKHQRPDIGVIDNKILQMNQTHLHADKKLLEKLNAAWMARASAVADKSHDHSCIDVYLTTVREIILTELSNAVLWSFKTHFADTAEQPDAMQIQAVMRLIRLVDSIALSNGRVYRSIIDSSS